MSKRETYVSRREFIKCAGAIGAGSLAAPMAAKAIAAAKPMSDAALPTRVFGKTGVRVPILGLGGVVDFESNQMLLRQAINMGITYWDTAPTYPPGSEKGIGKFFSKFPDQRKRIFLVTKSQLSDPAGWDFHLDRSLERMNTSYVDLFFVHGLSDLERLKPFERTKTWMEKKKSEGKIRLFGFSSHKNMEACMLDGARLGWIDGIMVTYNYRLLHTDKMKAALQACVKAGMGITAMKTQATAAHRDTGAETPTARRLIEIFTQKGYTPEQAKLKTVWDNPHIASICSQMPNMTILHANAAAAKNKTKLSHTEHALFRQYAAETQQHYCAGCADICHVAINGHTPVADVMRYLMYSRHYGHHQRARSLFERIPDHIRARMADFDYSTAEERCPQKLPIARLMGEAVEELT